MSESRLDLPNIDTALFQQPDMECLKTPPVLQGYFTIDMEHFLQLIHGIIDHLHRILIGLQLKLWICHIGYLSRSSTRHDLSTRY